LVDTCRIEVLPADHRDVAISRERLGLVLLRQRRYTEAEPIVLAALASYEKFTGCQRTLHVAEMLARLVELYTALAQPESAVPYRASSAASARPTRRPTLCPPCPAILATSPERVGEPPSLPAALRVVLLNAARAVAPLARFST
jgi:hypothetical protein